VSRTGNPDAALAAVIRRLRVERGLSQEAVAFKAGVTTGSVARLELEQSVPGWDTVRQITQALEVSLTDLAVAVEAEDRSSSKP
jgi:transcriptional regulator with XRE-family HTH domain